MQISRTVFGIYTNRTNAENAIEDLASAGYRSKDMSVLMKDSQEAEQLSSNTGVDVASGAASGITAGGVVGGIAGLLVGVGAITIPGIGALLIGGR